MSKRNCTLLSLHLVLVAGITAGYVCIYKKLNQKKSKLNLNCLD